MELAITHKVIILVEYLYQFAEIFSRAELRYLQVAK